MVTRAPPEPPAQAAPREEPQTSVRLAATLTHELGNPLASIKLSLQSLERSAAPLDPRARRRLSLAVREVRTIERILVALNEQVRPVRAPPRTCDLGALLEQALGEAAAELAELEAQVALESAPMLPEASLDARRVRVAVTQLLSVAAPSARGQLLPLRVAVEDGAVRLEVDAPAAGPRPSGSALSLAVAEAVAREHGGTLELEPRGERLLYRLRLPAPGAGAAAGGSVDS